MIHLYLRSENKKILGFTFHLFEGEKYVVDHDFYKDVVEMDRYFESSKCDIIGINLERFISFCAENINSTTVLVDEALTDLRKATKWRAKHKDEYEKFLNFITRADSKMMDLVNAQATEESKIKSYMMYKMLTDFVKTEV